MAAMELSLKKSRREVLQILWDIYYQEMRFWNGTVTQSSAKVTKKFTM